MRTGAHSAGLARMQSAPLMQRERSLGELAGDRHVPQPLNAGALLARVVTDTNAIQEARRCE